MSESVAPLISAERLSLGYLGRTVLRDVSFQVRRGEWWFLIGPNGQGKTTLLRGLLGLLPPLEGRLWRDSSAMAPDRLGFVPQRCDFNPTLPITVREFVELGLVGQRVKALERRERLAWALDQVDLSDQVESDHRALSGGQRQRALVARALIRRPEVLLLDEPTSGLDLTAEAALVRGLAQLNGRHGLTLLFISHNIELAARWASHVALVCDQSVRAGPASEVLCGDHLTAAYGLPVQVHRGKVGEATLHIGGAERALP